MTIFSKKFSPLLIFKRKKGMHKHSFVNFLSLLRVSKLFGLIFKLINIQSIDLNINVHNDNSSAVTGILTGCYWGIVGVLLSFLSHKFDLSNVDIAVKITPIFFKNDGLSEIFFDSIFNIRVGHIIIISIIVIFFVIYEKLCFLRIKRSGMLGKSSNRGIN